MPDQRATGSAIFLLLFFEIDRQGLVFVNYLRLASLQVVERSVRLLEWS